jgi:hypothetical protein
MGVTNSFVAMLSPDVVAHGRRIQSSPGMDEK